MKNSLLIAKREFMERLTNRSFQYLLIIGPLILLTAIYVLLKSGDQGKSSLKILIVDPAGLFEEKIAARQNEAVTYFFYNDYVELESFKTNPEFKNFDALIEINEKVLINKKVFLFYRETPSLDLKMKLKFDVERRAEEVMIEQFTQLSIDEFRRIKQPLNIDFRNVDDPLNKAENENAWVGFILGFLMILFIGMFGMSIVRSISREKSNRISEVLLSSVKAYELMLGKIIGIMWASLFQICIWIILVWCGILVFENYWFIDVFDAGHLANVQLSENELNELSQQNGLLNYNIYMDLFFHRINYGLMLPHFMIIFLSTYWLYSSFFISIGAISGNESDGQQFVIPVLLFLFFAIFAGYNSMYFPDSNLTQIFSFLPWTSGVVSLVKLSVGVTIAEYGSIIFSLFIMWITGALFLWLGSRVFKNGILSFGHRFSIKMLLNLVKK